MCLSLIELLDQLARLGVQVWADGDRLRVRAAAGVLTPALRAALESHKPGLLGHLRESTDEARPPIVRTPEGLAPPLSFAQQRLWFLAQLEPDSAAYNIPAAIRIGGRLDAGVIERAANEIVRRHEVLRTTFRNVQGSGVPVVHETMPIAVPVVDVSAESDAVRASTIRRTARAEARTLFDLANGPLVRVSLLRLAPDDHVLFFTIHHLASDGWSSRVFMRELAELYDAFSRGHASPLPALTIQYGDFAAWQRAWLSGERLDRQIAYWRQRLAALPVLDLPTDRPRPPLQTFDGASLQCSVPRDTVERLSRLARQEGATIFHVLLAGFAALLHQVTGADDLPIGSPVANRGHRELESLIGLFVNTVVLRLDVSGRPTFRELVRRARETSLDAAAHQDLPFEQLVAELQPARDLSRHALFQVVFVHQDNPVERQEVPGLSLRQLDTESWHVKFDLVVNTWEAQHELVVWWEYNSALFDRATIAGLFDRYARLLSAVADAPETGVADIDIFTAEELAHVAADPSVPALALEFDFAAS